jgi:hypothetical protein
MLLLVVCGRARVASGCLWEGSCCFWLFVGGLMLLLVVCGRAHVASGDNQKQHEPSYRQPEAT